MDYSSLIKSVSLLLGVIGGLFAIYKFYRRDEHFPRVQFDVEINFVGKEDDKHVVEIVASLDNKGVVPIKLTELEFSLRGLKSGEPLEEGDNKINKQLKLPHKIKDAPWIADMWEHTFVYPGVRTRYTHAAIVDDKYNYLLVRGLFIYESDEKFHTSAKLVKVPNQSIQ